MPGLRAPPFPHATDLPVLRRRRGRARRALPHRDPLGLDLGGHPTAGYQGSTPFGFGVVELPEGLRVIARLTEPDPARLSAGQPMRLAIVPLHTDDEGNDVVTYAFAPDRGTPVAGVAGP